MKENPHLMVANEFSGASPKRVISPDINFLFCGDVAMQLTYDTEHPRFNLGDSARILKFILQQQFIARRCLRISGKKGSCNRQIDTASARN